jgi:hypothetical protein
MLFGVCGTSWLQKPGPIPEGYCCHNLIFDHFILIIIIIILFTEKDKKMMIMMKKTSKMK